MQTREAVYEFMQEFQRTHGAPPTLDEIQENVEGLNYRSSAKSVVDALVQEGRCQVISEPGKSRRYRAIEPPPAPEFDFPDVLMTVVPAEPVTDG